MTKVLKKHCKMYVYKSVYQCIKPGCTYENTDFKQFLYHIFYEHPEIKFKEIKDSLTRQSIKNDDLVYIEQLTEEYNRGVAEGWIIPAEEAEHKVFRKKKFSEDDILY